MSRKEIVRDVYQQAERNGFTVHQGGRWDLILQPKTDEQVTVAKGILNKYENLGFIDGHRFNISVRRG